MASRRLPGLDFERELWNTGVRSIAGVDEAGPGPLAGPVVAAAVIFPRELTIKGVQDSKVLSATTRERLFNEIHAAALSVGVGVVSHEVIDRINILEASILAMHRALASLAQEPGYVLVDGNIFRHPSLSFRTIVRGDAISVTIAAASIVAKVTRDRMMQSYHEQFPEYGFDRHKGYGTREHLAAIERHGLCQIHRRSFRTQLTLPLIPGGKTSPQEEQ
jgi:ribonuclease HII